MFILGAELLLCEILVRILQTERDNLHVVPTQILPVGHVFVKHGLDLGRSQGGYRILPVKCEHIAFLHHRLAEKSRPLGKEESYDQQDDHAGDEPAGRKQPFHRFFKKFFHTDSNDFTVSCRIPRRSLLPEFQAPPSSPV